MPVQRDQWRGRSPERGGAPGRMGEIIAASRHRSERSLGSPALAVPRAAVAGDDVSAWRREGALGPFLPMLEQLLLEAVEDAGLVVALADAEGRLMWVDGDRRTRARVADMGFVPGADWSEPSMGTSAPGTALVVGDAVRVVEEEHYAPAVHPFSCTAVPIRDLDSGGVLGVLDVTGGPRAASVQSLALLRAAALAVESEFRMRTIAGERRGRPHRAPTAREEGEDGLALRLLGRGVGAAAPEIATGGGGAIRLGLRHAEILALLSRRPEGLTSGELGALLHEDGVRPVTLRAELVRLRQVLGAGGLEGLLRSRPYRLAPSLRSDVDRLLAEVDRGAHRRALRRYRGPVLPDSAAPGVVDLREQVRGTLREALLANGGAESLTDWLGIPGNEDDAEALLALLRLLPPRSPKRSAIRARLDGLGRNVHATPPGLG
ncbi:GAF domain-containing protein [Gulosibacter sp. 10]|uniref:GAF domain-containing protein n=1 Tax=Gulosibacter sp. 10 TaxID=1255570 RepID=UPI00097E96D1|nr:GAF domain-containing protein [Gulosibacter sp. 10]SJM53493.1 GAF domain-containing protein / Signal transduction response regulator [Gulosibacter sp. 10]